MNRSTRESGIDFYISPKPVVRAVKKPKKDGKNRAP